MSNFFRNLKIYRLTDNFPSITVLAEKLAIKRLTPCDATTPKTFGWIPPRGNPEEFIVSANGHHLIVLGSEQKVLPAAVVKQHVAERAKQIEEQQGEKPGRKQLRDLREQITEELLAKAFSKHGQTAVWIDAAGRWMGINAASPARVEEVIDHLKLTLEELPIIPLNPSISPQTAMTDWLAAEEAPSAFTIDQDCDLQAMSEQKEAIRYTRHTLSIEDIRPHLEAGKRAIRLALTWNDRISFVLSDDFSIKRIAFLDILKQQSEQDAEQGKDALEADVAILGGSFSEMAGDLLAALGGPCIGEATAA